MVERDLGVLDAEVDVEALEQLERAGPFGLGPVGDLDARLLAPEEVGYDGEIALKRKDVGDVAHDVVDAEDLLQDDDAGAGSRAGLGEIGHKTAAVGGGQTDIDSAHGVLPWAVCGTLARCPSGVTATYAASALRSASGSVIGSEQVRPTQT